MAERDRIYNKGAVDHNAILVALEIVETYLIIECSTKNIFKKHYVFFRNGKREKILIDSEKWNGQLKFESCQIYIRRKCILYRWDGH